MSRDVIPPARGEGGREYHPAWGMIGASRVHSTGAVMFDSDVKHQHYISVQLSTASRKRELNRDWLHAEDRVVEVRMSEAQWASFVSSMNVGSGVPCTVEYVRPHGRIPDMPFEPRLRESMDEVHGAAEKAAEKVAEAFAAYKEKKTAANLRHLQAMIDNMPANITFAAKSLVEHGENVVQRARADIEAMAVAKAAQLGIEPGDLGVEVQQLAPGEPG